MKKVLSLLAALTIAAGCVAGCSGTKENDGEVVTLTYVMAGPGLQQDSEKVWAAFNEKLNETVPGVKVEFKVIPLAEYKQKVMLMQSAQEPIDIINNYGIDFMKEVKNGNFIALDDLIKEHGKGIQKALPEWLLDYQKVDGEIYGIPSYQMCGGYRGILFFKDQAEQYLDMEALKKNLNENDEFNAETYDILTKYIEDLNAAGNKFKTATIINVKGVEQIAGGYGYAIMDENHTVKNIYASDEAKPRFEAAHEWYEKGYIREDALSATDDGNYTGKRDGFPFWDETYTPFVANQYSLKYGEELICIPYFEEYFTGMSNSAAGTSITSSCEHPELAMQVLNALQSDKELFNMLAFGIEGDHFTKVTDDSIKVEYEGTQSGTSDRYGLWKWILGNTELAYNVDQVEPEEYKDWVFNVANKSEWKSDLIGFMADTSGIQDYITQVNAIKDKYLQPLNVGCLPNWEETFNNYQKEVSQVGGEEIRKELQRQVDEFLAAKAQ